MSAYDIFEINSKKERELFSNSLVFFDTSVLLNFYYYSSNTKNEIVKNIFASLENRLWMSNQTHYEFSKNKETVKGKLASTYDHLLNKPEHSKEGDHIY